jgi:cell wall-associated NlpC family hydrolase
MRKMLASLVLTAFALVTIASFLAPAAHAATSSRRWRAYEYAVSKEGDWYQWGAAGPSTFDCSGLVYAAYRHEGFAIPRTTYEMLAWPGLRFVSHANARMGYLVFYGSGHVELYAGRQTTYGALETGTRIWWHRWWPTSWWRPTAYAHVRDSG